MSISNSIRRSSMLKSTCIKIFFYSVFFAIPQAHAWTYYFFISGDRDQMGPTWATRELEDQAEKLYLSLQNLAQSDRKHRYVIYYDPRGGGSNWWPTRSYSRLEVYARSRLILEKTWKETDSTDVEFLNSIVKSAEDKILDRDSVHRVEDPTLFFYYGEHLPGSDRQKSKHLIQDESAPGHLLTTSGLHQVLKYIGARVRDPRLVILQSCFTATFPFLKEIPHFAAYPSTVLAPAGSISNVALNFSMLQETELGPSRLATAFQNGQDNVRYRIQFERFLTDQVFEKRLSQITKLQNNALSRANAEWNSRVADWNARRTIESLIDPPIDPGLGEGDLFVPLPHFLDLLNQVSPDPLERESWLEEKPWSNVLQLLSRF
jgi:hypothetical protein